MQIYLLVTFGALPQVSIVESDEKLGKFGAIGHCSIGLEMIKNDLAYPLITPKNYLIIYVVFKLIHNSFNIFDLYYNHALN